MAEAGRDGEHDAVLPAINISNRVVQVPSTSSSGEDSIKNMVDDEYDIGDYITDDEKMTLTNNDGHIIDSYLEDFLQREDELRQLMNLNNFNQILSNEVSDKDEDCESLPKLCEEDSAVLTNLETKLLDIQKRYNALMNISSIESESDEEEDKVEEDMCEFEEAHKKLQDIDKCLENISNEKNDETPQTYLKVLPNEDTKFIEKEYLNSLNEMTKRLDSLGNNELEEFLDGKLLTCDEVLGLSKSSEI